MNVFIISPKRRQRSGARSLTITTDLPDEDGDYEILEDYDEHLLDYIWVDDINRRESVMLMRADVPLAVPTQPEEASL